MLDALDRRVVPEAHATCRRAFRQRVREPVRVARFVARRERPADDACGRTAQCGLDGEAFAGGDRLHVATVFAHDGSGTDAGLEFTFVRVEMQDPAFEMVVPDAGLRPQCLQRRATVQSERHELTDVLARAPRQAFTQEVQAPAPLRGIGPEAEQQRGILAPEPADDLRRRVRIGPRFRVAHGDLAAIREAGLEAGSGLAIDDGDGVTCPREKPRGGGADDAAAEDEDVHG